MHQGEKNWRKDFEQYDSATSLVCHPCGWSNLWFNIFEAYPYPEITGENLLLSREIPGFYFIFDKGKFARKKNSYAYI